MKLGIHDVTEAVGIDLIAAGVDFNDLEIDDDDKNKVTVTWRAVPGSHFTVNFDLDISDEYLAGPNPKQIIGMRKAIADIAKRVANEIATYAEEICQFWRVEVWKERQDDSSGLLLVDIEDVAEEVKVRLQERCRVQAERCVMTRAEFDREKSTEAAVQ